MRSLMIFDGVLVSSTSTAVRIWDKNLDSSEVLVVMLSSTIVRRRLSLQVMAARTWKIASRKPSQ